MAPATETSSCVFFSFKQETLAWAAKRPRPCLASPCFVLFCFLHLHGHFSNRNATWGDLPGAPGASGFEKVWDCLEVAAEARRWEPLPRHGEALASLHSPSHPTTRSVYKVSWRGQ